MIDVSKFFAGAFSAFYAQGVGKYPRLKKSRLTGYCFGVL
jgi:hypothetical protein